MPRDADSRTRLLVIDPMPLARKALGEALRGSAAVEVVGAVSGAAAAERHLAAAPPEVILLDVQPPVGPEVERLRRLREQWPIPVVLFTALEGGDREAVIDALAVPRPAVLAKPAVNLARQTLALGPAIEAAVRRAHQDDLLRWRKKRAGPVVAPPPRAAPAGRVIAVGASTGGTEAIAEVLGRLPRAVPGLVIVQHMPAGFTRLFAERLNDLGDLEVKEAADGDEVRPGRALLAPGGLHMTLAPSAGGYVVRVAGGARVNGHRPSVDVLMRSVARHAGPRAVGVLLTGMGNDGAAGMKAIRDAGGGTIAQDEATSVVYGMPREAYLCGGAAKVVPLADVPRQILSLAAGPGA
jgi:two-component system chemotaxis response regulator CheB